MDWLKDLISGIQYKIEKKMDESRVFGCLFGSFILLLVIIFLLLGLAGFFG